MNRNVPFFGFIIGLLLPILGYVIVFFIWRHPDMDFTYYWHTIKMDSDTLARVLTMSLLINLAPFLYYNYKRLDLTMRGIVIATVLYAVVVVLIKFVWR